jgi:hypothetical protein
MSPIAEIVTRVSVGVGVAKGDADELLGAEAGAEAAPGAEL